MVLMAVAGLLTMVKSGLPLGPPSLPYEPIQTAELRQMVGVGRGVLIDVRAPDIHAQGAIPGSVNVPMDRWMNGTPRQVARLVAESGWDRETLVIYCGDEWCRDSRMVAARLRGVGIPSKVYVGGYRAWVEESR